MLLHLSNISQEPLHAQISRQVRAKILSGELEEGEPLPSIRVMARLQKVSVITVQRSYDDLYREGLILSWRGKGFTVAQISNEKKQKLALGRLENSLTPIIKDAIAGGLKNSEVQRVVKKILDLEE